MSDPAGEIPKLISRPKIEEMTKPYPITDVYDRLGMKWSWTRLWWDDKTNKKAFAGQKPTQNDPLRPIDVRAKDGQEFPANALMLYCNGSSPFTMVDIDADNEYTRHAQSLMEECCNMVAKTNKGFHYYFKSSPEIGQTAKKDIAIDIRTPYSNGICFAEPSNYNIPGKGKVEYKWVKVPAEDEELAPMPTELIGFLQEIGYEPHREAEAPRNQLIVSTTPKPKKPTSIPTVNLSTTEYSIADVMGGLVPDRLVEINNLLKCLTTEWLNNRENWYRMGLCLKGIEDSSDMCELFVAHSSRADSKYNTASAREENRRWFHKEKTKGRIGKSSLKHWAKTCNPAMYFANAKDDLWRLLENANNPNICEMFYISMAGDIVYSPGAKCYYVYDPIERLWKGGDDGGAKSHIYNLFTQTCHNTLARLQAELPVANTEVEQEERKAKIKMLNEIRRKTDGQSAVAMVNNNLPAICMLPEDPANFFNQQPHLLPLANGVFDFEEEKLVPFEREQYFTFRIPITYNPKADMTLMERAMKMWFKSNEAVIDFIQYYIGYCLTGNRERQDMMGVWGDSAGNGKSLLWGELLPILLGGEKCYYTKITSEAFTNFKQGDSNDQIFNMNGKRYAFLSEPRKKFDTALLKELTGDKQFKVRTLYKGCIAFDCITKMVMAFNTLPELDITDKGMNRRFNTVEQDVKFLPPGEYDALTEADIATGRFGKQDGEFVEALLADTEGCMRWAIMGACAFYKNKKRLPPAEMMETKRKAEVEADMLGAWCRQYIITTKTEDGKEIPCDDSDRISMKDLKKRWADDRLCFGQNEKAFVGKFMGRIEGLVPGSKADPGRAGKGEAKIKNAMLLTDEMIADREKAGE